MIGFRPKKRVRPAKPDWFRLLLLVVVAYVFYSLATDKKFHQDVKQNIPKSEMLKRIQIPPKPIEPPAVKPKEPVAKKPAG